MTTAAATDQGSDGLYVVGSPGASPVEVVGGLPTPLGLVWSGEVLYVASTGRVDAFSGLQAVRFAKDEVIARWPASVGESNNIVQAPDGGLLVGVSAPCDHCNPASPMSAAILTLRPDGSDLRIYASGIRAPFGLVYYPGTSDLFVTMNQRNDLGSRTPGDWLAEVRGGENWGFPGCYGQAGVACGGVPDPIAVLDQHAAVGGVAILTGQLGSSVGTSAIVAEWMAGKVQRVPLARSGSTYRGSVKPFLAGLKRPLPVLATSDGSQLVGDWGTGTIYRITKR